MTLPLDIQTPGTPAGGHVPGAAADFPAAAVSSVAGNETGEGSAPATSAPVHVIGLDVSLTATGIACTHGATTIRSAGKKGDTLSQRQQRLRHLRVKVLNHVTDCAAARPLVVIEGPSYGSRDGAAHDRSGLWWQLVQDFTDMGWPVIEIPPSTRAKFITGKGNAGKDEVLAAAIKRLPIDVTNNNEADAAVLCAIGSDLRGQPICELPAVQRAAIDKHRPTMGGTA